MQIASAFVSRLLTLGFSDLIHTSKGDPRRHADVMYFDTNGNAIDNPNPDFFENGKPTKIWHVYP